MEFVTTTNDAIADVTACKVAYTSARAAVCAGPGTGPMNSGGRSSTPKRLPNRRTALLQLAAAGNSHVLRLPFHAPSRPAALCGLPHLCTTDFCERIRRNAPMYHTAGGEIPDSVGRRVLGHSST